MLFNLGSRVTSLGDGSVNAFADVELLVDPSVPDEPFQIGVWGGFTWSQYPRQQGAVRIRLWGQRGLESFRATPKTKLTLGVPSRPDLGYSSVEINFVIPE